MAPPSPLVRRQIPWPVRARIVYGGHLQQFGWLFLAFSLPFLWIFGGNADWSGAVFALSPSESTAGVVEGAEATNMSENESTIMEVSFRYAVEGRSLVGRGYTVGSPPAQGSQVQVEYLGSRPTYARAERLRRAPFSWWASLIVLVFPVGGLFMIVPAQRRQRRAARLLSTGEITRGMLLDREETGVEINEEPVYLYRFEYAVGDRIYTLETRTHDTHVLEDDDEESIVFDPRDPAQAATLNDLPGHVFVDHAGELQIRDRRWIRVLFFPAVVVATAAAAAFVAAT